MAAAGKHVSSNPPFRPRVRRRGLRAAAGPAVGPSAKAASDSRLHARPPAPGGASGDLPKLRRAPTYLAWRSRAHGRGARLAATVDHMEAVLQSASPDRRRADRPGSAARRSPSSSFRIAIATERCLDSPHLRCSFPCEGVVAAQCCFARFAAASAASRWTPACRPLRQSTGEHCRQSQPSCGRTTDSSVLAVLLRSPRNERQADAELVDDLLDGERSFDGHGRVGAQHPRRTPRCR
jgi:hypothetical protein